MTEAIETIDYRSCTVEIVPDEDAESPRGWSNPDLFLIRSMPRVGNLGDDVLPDDLNIGPPDCWNCGESLTEDGDGNWTHASDGARFCERPAIEDEEGATLAEPDGESWPTWEAYLVERHGMVPGSPVLALRVHEDWRPSLTVVELDDEPDGVAFCTVKGVEDCGTPPEMFEEAIRADVAVYSSWLEGESFGWVAKAPDGTVIDSCWGYVGEESYADGSYVVSCGQEAIDGFIAEQEAKVAKWTELAGMAVR